VKLGGTSTTTGAGGAFSGKSAANAPLIPNTTNAPPAKSNLFMAEPPLICRKLRLCRRAGLLLFSHIQEKSLAEQGLRSEWLGENARLSL
jgi:hypothetical protein